MEGCPFVMPSFLCSNWANKAPAPARGDTYSPTSACFQSTLVPSYSVRSAHKNEKKRSKEGAYLREDHDPASGKGGMKKRSKKGAHLREDHDPAIECAPGCEPTWPGDNICDTACNVTACAFDGGDCQQDECAPGCPISWIGDDYCDTTCQNEACSDDGGDCEGGGTAGTPEVGCYEPRCTRRGDGWYDLEIMDPSGVWRKCEQPSMPIGAVVGYEGAILCPDEWQRFCHAPGSSSPTAGKTLADAIGHAENKYPECKEMRSWSEILSKNQYAGADPSLMSTGGMGKWMVVDKWEVWLCLTDNSCSAAGDPFCFTYDEVNQKFAPLGPNSELDLIAPA